MWRSLKDTSVAHNSLIYLVGTSYSAKFGGVLYVCRTLSSIEEYHEMKSSDTTMGGYFMSQNFSLSEVCKWRTQDRYYACLLLGSADDGV